MPARFRRDWLGGRGSWLASRASRALPLRPRTLLLRASIRLIARLGLERGTPLVSGSTLALTDGESPLSGMLALREPAATVDLNAGLAMLGLTSVRARQSSVKLRQRLSALRRTCRSGTDAPVMIELAEKRVPCGPALPVISANSNASEATASSDR